MKNTSIFKRLYFDIETSPNIGFFWQAGYKLNIPHDNIIKERAVICIAYKWAHENKVHCLEWNKGEDKQLLKEFLEILNEADEIVGQNSDNFDVKWLRTRCLKHKYVYILGKNNRETKIIKTDFLNLNKIEKYPKRSI